MLLKALYFNLVYKLLNMTFNTQIKGDPIKALQLRRYRNARVTAMHEECSSAHRLQQLTDCGSRNLQAAIHDRLHSPSWIAAARGLRR